MSNPHAGAKTASFRRHAGSTMRSHLGTIRCTMLLSATGLASSCSDTDRNGGAFGTGLDGSYESAMGSGEDAGKTSTSASSSSPTTGATNVSDETAGPGPDDSTSGPSTSGPSTSGVSSSATSPDTGSSPKFDLGNALDVPRTSCDPELEDCGCTAVDILFVIDNSGSMQQHAGAVRGAFEPFVQDIVSALPPATSVHIALTRGTGLYNPGDRGGWNPPNCAIDRTDGSWNPPDLSNNGVNGQQGRLFEHAGLRYFEFDTSQNPQPLREWFAGSLDGAIQGSDHSNNETVVASAGYVFHPVNDTFNTGFMRQQAVLVIFLLSDSPDLAPPAIPTSDFVSMVSAAKAGCGNRCIVTTGAIADCYDRGGIVNTRLYEFMNGFGSPPASYVYFASPFDFAAPPPDFRGVLGTALADVIGTTCQQIPPEG